MTGEADGEDLIDEVGQMALIISVRATDST